MKIELTVNGEAVAADVEPRRLLGDFLREQLELRGTHLACEHGECGACTVLLDGQPALSCLTLAVQADGAEVETVESLAREDGELGPLQQAFRDHHALQCGYCTAGFLMTATHLLREDDGTIEDEQQLRAALCGNLCRCTGYHPIVDAIQDAAGRLRQPSA
jgi:carbon-monoxide dehydrogenase small subunit